MKPLVALCFFALLLSAHPHAATDVSLDATTPWATGEAWSEDGETLLYREYLYAENDNFDHPTRVLYMTADEELFAEKRIDYSTSPSAPAIDFIDYRSEAAIRTQYGSSNTGRSPELLQVSFRGFDSEQLRKVDVRADDSLIADAGFDVYIRQNWDELTENSRLVANFLVPSRLDTVRVALNEVSTDTCRVRAENTHCFEVRPAGMLRLVSWFVDPIRVAYDGNSRRLIMYDGMGNIADDDGENRSVLIRYEYSGSH